MNINTLSSINGEAASLSAPKKTNTPAAPSEQKNVGLAQPSSASAKPSTEGAPMLATSQPSATTGNASARGRIQADNEELDKAVSSVNQFFQNERRQLAFSVNEAAVGGFVIEVRNQETEEVIRQIPPEAVVKLAERLQEQSAEDAGLLGLLVKERA